LLHQQSGNNDRALNCYQMAVEEEPEFAEALLNLGHVLKHAGQEEEALERWRKALELKPELAAGYFNS